MDEEQTILELAYELAKGLNCLEADLNKVLNRNVTGAAEHVETPTTHPHPSTVQQNPSVIGEIVEVLRMNSNKLSDLSIMARNEIFIKLDKRQGP